MRKGIATDVVERVAVGQLGLPEHLLLLRRREEFQFSGDDLLHTAVRDCPILLSQMTAIAASSMRKSSAWCTLI